MITLRLLIRDNTLFLYGYDIRYKDGKIDMDKDHYGERVLTLCRPGVMDVLGIELKTPCVLEAMIDIPDRFPSQVARDCGWYKAFLTRYGRSCLTRYGRSWISASSVIGERAIVNSWPLAERAGIDLSNLNPSLVRFIPPDTRYFTDFYAIQTILAP